MKFLLKTALIAAVLGGSATASAATFDFSYAFTDGQMITGSLDGTLNGTSITGISDLQIALNGIAFAGGTGPLQIVGADPAASFAPSDSVAPVFSTIGSQNDFYIADVDSATNGNFNYQFSFVNDPTFGPLIGAQNFLATDSFSQGSTQAAADFGVSGTWSVTPVPLPGALPLLLSGLGLFGLARRRNVSAK